MEDKPFESIEGAQEYLKLLHAAVLEAKQEVEGDVRAQAAAGPQRRLEALRLVLYKFGTTGKAYKNKPSHIERLAYAEKASPRRESFNSRRTYDRDIGNGDSRTRRNLLDGSIGSD